MDIRDQNGKRVDIEHLERREQDLAREYIRHDDVVLELGARYGSVSCVINSKLACKTNQVVVEPDDRVWAALERNRVANHCGFHIVKGFVSGKRLALTNLNAYHGGYAATAVPAGEADTKIPSFSLDEIKGQYGLQFNVLVADCEGFLGTFFEENPDFYDGLRLILFEADYPDKCDYGKIRQALKDRGFNKQLEGHQNVWIRSSV